MQRSNWKPGHGQAIETLYAWIVTEPDGGEGVAGMSVPALGGMVPLVGADMARMRSLRPHAEQIRRRMDMPVRLVRFATREDLEILSDDIGEVFPQGGDSRD